MEGCERCTLSYSIEWHWPHVSNFLLMKVTKKKNVNSGRAIPFSTIRGKMEGCENCTLLISIDGHLSHVSIFLLSKVITKINLILDMQFPFSPVEVEWRVVKHVHCPLLLMDTGLTSLSF